MEHIANSLTEATATPSTHSAKSTEILPAWNNSTEYKAIHSADFNADLDLAKKYIAEIEQITQKINPLLQKKEFTASERPELIKALQNLDQKREQAIILLANLSTYAHCELSLDAKNEIAKKFDSQGQQLWAQLSSATVASHIFLKQCDESILNDYLQSEQTRHSAFNWKHERKMRAHSLSAAEEKVIAQLNPYSSGGWGNLYSEIAGSLKVQMLSQGEMGLAQAAGLLRGPDEKIRKEAWEGVQAAWKSVETSCAAVINNLVGYRKEIYRQRSHTKPLHFLDVPLHESRIEAATLDAMMSTVQKNIEVPRRALRAMAKSLGKKQIDPWDILAPSPRLAAGSRYPFSEGLAMVREAFGSVDAKMGEFVDTMSKNGWIEARILPNKGPGAHCTGFLKSNTPRVFQSYMGSMKDISTLAHELGHAYHSWVMRDLAFDEKEYPMTVAETASIFSETLLAERLFAKAKDAEKFTIAWEDVCDAVSMLVNIPARFDFEKDLYEARENGPLSPKELNELTGKAWRKWYGEEISKTDDQYWMSKMHFNFSGISFYNYPYTFGYLFSLGIYATREKLGDKFHQAYVDLLRDSGRMSVEELVQKHLGADIRQPQFWQDSLSIIEKKVAAFEKLV